MWGSINPIFSHALLRRNGDKIISLAANSYSLSRLSQVQKSNPDSGLTLSTTDTRNERI